jgi:hypothetical protein
MRFNLGGLAGNRCQSGSTFPFGFSNRLVVVDFIGTALGFAAGPYEKKLKVEGGSGA